MQIFRCEWEYDLYDHLYAVSILNLWGFYLKLPAGCVQGLQDESGLQHQARQMQIEREVRPEIQICLPVPVWQDFCPEFFSAV